VPDEEKPGMKVFLGILFGCWLIGLVSSAVSSLLS
jgi:hypothetical protein